MKKFLDRFWFIEAPPERLAWVRILIGIYAFLYVAHRYTMYVEIGETTSSLFAPVGLARLFNAPMPIGLWQAILIATLAVNVLFILGAFHRVTGPLFAVLLLLVLSYRNSWSMVYHSHTLMVLHVGLLGLLPSADAVSVDARRKGARDPDWIYGWALQLICAVTVATYFLSGVAKVVGPLGWAWVEGESLRSQILIDALRKDVLGKGSSPFADSLYDYVGLFTAIGVLTLVLELGAPLALLGRRIAVVFVILVYGMHVSIWFLMEIWFQYQLWGIAFLSFLPLERAANAVRRPFRRSAGPPPEPATL